MMLDFELSAKFHNHSIVEVSPIISDDPLGDTIAADKVMFYEADDHILSDKGERGCFNPLW